MSFTVPLLYIDIKLLYPKKFISVLIHKRSNQFLKIKVFQVKSKSNGNINNNIHAKYCLTFYCDELFKIIMIKQFFLDNLPFVRNIICVQSMDNSNFSTVDINKITFGIILRV